MNRNSARVQILKRANRLIRQNKNSPVRTLYMRHIQQAVFIVRQRKAINPRILEDAGFNRLGPHAR